MDDLTAHELERLLAYEPQPWQARLSGFFRRVERGDTVKLVHGRRSSRLVVFGPDGQVKYDPAGLSG